MARPLEMPWFRCWVGQFAHWALRAMPPGHRWLLLAATAVARKSPEPGRLLIAAGMPASVAHLADAAALPADEVEAGISALIQAGFLHREGAVLVITNWQAEQPLSDNSTQRTRDWREREAARRGAPAPDQSGENGERWDMGHDGNVPETSRATPRRRSPRRRSQRAGDVPVTAQETETETEDVGTTVPTGATNMNDPSCTHDPRFPGCRVWDNPADPRTTLERSERTGFLFIPAAALASPYDVWDARCAMLDADPGHDEAAKKKALGIIKRLHDRSYSYVDIFRCWRYLARQEVELNPEAGWRQIAADFPAVWNVIKEWADRGRKDRPPVRKERPAPVNGAHRPLDVGKYTGDGPYAAIFNRTGQIDDATEEDLEP